MARRIHRKLYRNWSPGVKTKLRRNNFGLGGLMRASLDDNPVTYVMLDDDELIGWALVLKCSYRGDFAMFFVKRRYRRKGVGTRLVERIKKHHDDIYVDASGSRAAEGFFDAAGL